MCVVKILHWELYFKGNKIFHKKMRQNINKRWHFKLMCIKIKIVESTSKIIFIFVKPVTWTRINFNSNIILRNNIWYNFHSCCNLLYISHFLITCTIHIDLFKQCHCNLIPFHALFTSVPGNAKKRIRTGGKKQAFERNFEHSSIVQVKVPSPSNAGSPQGQIIYLTLATGKHHSHPKEKEKQSIRRFFVAIIFLSRTCSSLGSFNFVFWAG